MLRRGEAAARRAIIADDYSRRFIATLDDGRDAII